MKAGLYDVESPSLRKHRTNAFLLFSHFEPSVYLFISLENLNGHFHV